MKEKERLDSSTIDPYETPLTDARLEKDILKDRAKAAANMPNDVTLGDIPTMRVAFKRGVYVTLVAGVVLIASMNGMDSIGMSLVGFVVFAGWGISMIILIIAIFQHVFNMREDNGLE